jgi:hypothetical protein
MRLFSFILYLLISSECSAQLIVNREKSFGGSHNENISLLKRTRDGGYIVGGSTQSSDGDIGHHFDINNYFDYWIFKIDSANNLQWEKSFGGNGWDVLSSLDTTNDGGFIICGRSDSNDSNIVNHGGFDAYILKLDSAGNIIWSKTYGDSEDNDASDIHQLPDGGFIVTGSTDTSGNQNLWVFKLDSNGTKLWDRIYGGTMRDIGLCVRVLKDSSFIVDAWSKSNDGTLTNHHGPTSTLDVWLLKLDQDGFIQWEKSYGGTDDDGGAAPNSILISNDGAFVHIGSSYSDNLDVTGHHGSTSSRDIWIFKADSLGHLLWELSLGGTDEDDAYDIQQLNDGSYVVIGITLSTDGDVSSLHHWFTEIWLIRISSTGQLLSQSCIGGNGNDTGISLVVDDSLLTIGATTDSHDGDITYNHGLGDIWIASVSTPSALNIINQQLKQNDDLFKILNKQPYYVTLLFNNEWVNTSVRIYDQFGKLLLNKNTNQNHFQIDTEFLPEGIYYVTVSDGKIAGSKKLLIVRQ